MRNLLLGWRNGTLGVAPDGILQAMAHCLWKAKKL